ncbi:hypothetical protein CBR_g45268 [Chara braunii]|uniref:Vacuolar protein sorting-associated protein 54 C-terminal domain-containing protein n=1 Tax=Chara braunii TaxID=69332 RepID=A0A388K3D2_CHABU|nr:hypothetical protein CBR_g45268 [Chara braunii]|eukprot:GBG64574.1 hypothetical protein CBR_g45268 [Chara braunii]
MSKITALLEQETWVAVDAPPEFQVIVDILVDGLITRGTGTDFGGHGSGISAVNGIDTSLDGSLDATLLPHQGSSNAKGGEQTGNGVAVPDPSKERDDDGGRHERRATVGEEGPAEKSQPSDAAATSEDPPRAAAESQRAEPSGGDAEAAKASEVGEAGPSGAPGPSPENVKRETGDGVDSARSGGASSELREGRSSADSTTGSNGSSTASSVAVGKGKKVKEKQSIRTLVVRESKFHVVGSALILLKMIAEYVDIANFLPALATEVVHRVAEILKFFNSRTCQLVLGAGAMQVDVRRALAFHIPEARKALLLTEVDRVGQDYRVHRDEIHSKLVQIMRERLQVHLRTLPAQVEGWNNPDNGDTQPSQFARNLTKEVGVLHRVLSPLLLESDIRSIFRRQRVSKR